MSIAYMIGPVPPSDVSVELTGLRNAIRQHWRGAIVWDPRGEASSGEDCALEWDLTFGGYRIGGYLQRRSPVIVLRGDVRGWAHFACWYRTLVPPEVKLLLWEDDYSAHLWLRPTTPVSYILFCFTDGEEGEEPPPEDLVGPEDMDEGPETKGEV